MEQLTLFDLAAEANMPPVGSRIELDAIGRWLQYTVERRTMADAEYTITCTADNPLPWGHWPGFRVILQGWSEGRTWWRVKEERDTA